MGIFRKKEVPDELPNLALESINDKPGMSPIRNAPVQPPQIQPQLPMSEVAPQIAQPVLAFPDGPSINVEELRKLPKSEEDETGYFKEIKKKVTEAVDDIDKLDNWYKNKFANKDMVSQMREYWEKQQPEFIFKNMTGDLKVKLSEKTNRLHQLEKEWQESYFNLLAKEDEIRKHESELKSTLSEFMDIYKRSSKKGPGLK